MPPTDAQILDHLECLNDLRAKLKRALENVDTCIEQALRWNGKARKKNGNGGKKTGIR